ncbi:MAG: cation-translocating P-type ATPase [Anaerolineales bacterium]|nr:MAG: cation-translocating P-type ATPase [Anaerolineales bacterium]
MKENEDWHSQSVEKVIEALNTHPGRGLSTMEAQARLAQYGPNQLQERPRPTFWRMLLGQFDNFLVLILISASVVSFLLGEYVDAGAIMAIVILNAILGVVQESKAEEALAALKKLAAPEAQVVRDDHLITVAAQELVPGDLVTLGAGNYVPADVRLIESFNLKIDEASLTGESVPVQKKADAVLSRNIPLGDRHTVAHMSTLVTYGRGRGAVVATGMDTEIGLIAEMIQTYEEEPTPLQVKLDQLGKWLGAACLAICAVILVIGLLRDTRTGVILTDGLSTYWQAYQHKIVELFMTAVSLAIAAVPEGLPAVVTIGLALGMQRMISRHALIRKLPAVETLGSASVICSDKTGTLTQNEMMVVQMYVDQTLLSISGEGYRPMGEVQEAGRRAELRHYPSARPLLQAALLCNDAQLEREPADDGSSTDNWRMVGDPTEGALVVAAAKADLWKDKVETVYPRLAEVPFDSERKRMSTIHPVPEDAGEGALKSWAEGLGPYVAYVKGAPDIILELCNRVLEDGREFPLDEGRRQRILEINAALASNALRVLGVAYRSLNEVPENPTPEAVERDLVFMGLVGMIDPARPEVKEAIAVARKAGIKTAMVTGDYKNTAVAIAHELDLITHEHEGRVLTGAELDEMDEVALAEIAEEVDVYARVSPQHKVKIVEALKRCGHVVAMTGDGVNDAPALKRANIGVAMGITGTDVSKETADMVLTNDNYASIVSAVEEGRIIYSNIRKFVYYLISCNMGEIMIIFLAMLAGLPLPLTAIQLLVLNLITDGAPALALGLEKGEPDIMDQPPRPMKEPIINRQMVWGIVVQTIAITAATMIAFIVGLRRFPDNLAAAQTMAFATLSISELFRAYTSRSERYPLFGIGVLSNKYMQWAVLASLVILLSIIYVPFLDPIFDTVPLGLNEWLVMLPLMLIPSIAAEINKSFLMRAGPRQKMTTSPTA